MVQEKLHDMHKGTCLTNLSKQSKLRIYSTYKTSYSTETYVEANLPRNQRSLIARLRSGTLPLNIETMRFGLFHKPEDRLCKFCSVVEDENHFIFECKLFETRRLAFFSSLGKSIDYIKNLSNNVKWQMLMSKSVIYKFGKYVQDIFQQRQTVLGQSIQ